MERSAVTRSHRASDTKLRSRHSVPRALGGLGARQVGAGSAPGADGPCGPCGERLEGVRWRPRKVSIRTSPEEGPGCRNGEFVGQAEFV